MFNQIAGPGITSAEDRRRERKEDEASERAPMRPFAARGKDQMEVARLEGEENATTPRNGGSEAVSVDGGAGVKPNDR